MRLVEGEDYYETDPSAMAERLPGVGSAAAKPHPAKELGWEAKRNWRFQGPLVYLFIDDLDAVPAQAQIQQRLPDGMPAPTTLTVPTWGPLTRHLANAREIGLRVVMTHKAAGAFIAESTPNTVAGQDRHPARQPDPALRAHQPRRSVGCDLRTGCRRDGAS